MDQQEHERYIHVQTEALKSDPVRDFEKTGKLAIQPQKNRLFASASLPFTHKPLSHFFSDRGPCAPPPSRPAPPPPFTGPRAASLLLSAPHVASLLSRCVAQVSDVLVLRENVMCIAILLRNNVHGWFGCHCAGLSWAMSQQELGPKCG